MILKNQIITNIKIESVNDLYKLKPFLEDGTLKINKSQIAREFEVDRRTVDKYINGYTKPASENNTYTYGKDERIYEAFIQGSRHKQDCPEKVC